MLKSNSTEVKGEWNLLYSTLSPIAQSNPFSPSTFTGSGRGLSII